MKYTYWTKEGRFETDNIKLVLPIPNGGFHREDGHALEWADGSKLWYINGKFHRENGPAIEYPNGSKYWWIYGKRHREDGLAVERADGIKEWWLNGNELPYEEVENWLEENNIDLSTISGQMAFKLRWA